LDDFDYLELRACRGGCVGGALTVEEPFVAKHRIEELRVTRGDKLGIAENRAPDLSFDDITHMVEAGQFALKAPVEPRPMMQLGTNIAETITRMKELEQLLSALPGIDCGSCGAPTCRAFAEDVVLGRAQITDCTFKLRERLEGLVREMTDLTGQLPHTLKTQERKAKNGT
jgi:hypothetical protein